MEFSGGTETTTPRLSIVAIVCTGWSISTCARDLLKSPAEPKRDFITNSPFLFMYPHFPLPMICRTDIWCFRQWRRVRFRSMNSCSGKRRRASCLRLNRLARKGWPNFKKNRHQIRKVPIVFAVRTFACCGENGMRWSGCRSARPAAARCGSTRPEVHRRARPSRRSARGSG